MGLTKQQLEALNLSSFPNNNAGAITPDILRQYNAATIANTVNQDTYTTDSASFDARIDAINFDSSSLVSNTIFNAYTQSTNVFTASISTSVGLLQTFSGSQYKADSSSFDTRINSFASASIPTGTVSSSAQISALGFATTSSVTASINTLSSSIFQTDATQSTNLTNLSSSTYRTDATQSFQITANALTASNATTALSQSLYFTDTTQSVNLTNLSSSVAQTDFTQSTKINSLTALTASTAYTNVNNTFSGTQSFVNVTVSGTASVAFLNVTYQSSSVIYSSGSNQLGDALNDTQILSGSVFIVGSGSVNGNRILTTADTASLTATTASYVTGSRIDINYIDFNTASATPTWKSGRVFWDNTDGCLGVYNAEADITLQVGQEQWVKVINNTGVAIANGAAVRLVGAQGDNPEIVLARAEQMSGSVATTNQILGIATHTIETGTIGYVTTLGNVRSLNTNAYTEGQVLWVSSSAGLLTSTVPVAPYERIPVATVVKVGPGGSGIIYVAPIPPIDFATLSSVEISGSYSTNDMWIYEGNVWKHKLKSEIGLTTTSSFNAFTQSISASVTTNSSSIGLLQTFSGSQYKSDSASFDSRILAITSSGGTIATGSFATTGSNSFTGSQTINGNIILTGSTATIQNAKGVGIYNDLYDLDYTLKMPIQNTIGYIDELNLPHYYNGGIQPTISASAIINNKNLVKVTPQEWFNITASVGDNHTGILSVEQSTGWDDINNVFGVHGNYVTSGSVNYITQRGLSKVGIFKLGGSIVEPYIGQHVYVSDNGYQLTLGYPTGSRVLRYGYVASFEQSDPMNMYVRQIFVDPVWEKGETLIDLNVSSSLTITGSLVVSGSTNFTGLTSSTDILVNSLTVGKGGGNIASNIAFGSASLQSNTTATNNIAIGNGALQLNTTAVSNIAIGTGTLGSQAFSGNGYNIAIGPSVLNLLGSTGGANAQLSQNTIIGANSGKLMTIGARNTIIGAAVWQNANNAERNTGLGRGVLSAIGQDAGIGSGSKYNTAIGHNALFTFDSGSNNTFIHGGSNAGDGVVYGSNNNVIGMDLGLPATMESNTIIGRSIAGLSSPLSNNVILADGAGNITLQKNGPTDSVRIPNGLEVTSSLFVAGAQTITGSLIITGSVATPPVALTITSDTASIDFSKGSIYTLTLVSSSVATYITASNLVPGQTANLLITQASTLSGSIVWASAFKFPTGSSYTGSAVVNAIDLISFVTVNNTTIYSVGAKNLV